MKKIPMRQCIGCQELKPKNELIRVIRTPEDEICIDTTGKRNGRGAYVCRNKACFETAFRRKGLERSLKCPVSKEIYEKLREELDSLDR